MWILVKSYSFNISQEFSMKIKQISYLGSKIQLVERKNHWKNSKKIEFTKIGRKKKLP